MRMRLATKFTAIIIGVLLIGLTSSLFGLFAAYRFRTYNHQIVGRNLASVQAAEELGIALLEQRGYVSLYLLDDGNRAWLDELAGKTESFAFWLDKARISAESEHEKQILDRLELVYADYHATRGEAVAAFERGDMDEARRIVIEDVTRVYSEAFGLCEDFIDANDQRVAQVGQQMSQQLEWVLMAIGGCVLFTFVMGGVLTWLLLHGVLRPLRLLADDARQFHRRDGRLPSEPSDADEVNEVGRHLRMLMTDVAETRTRLAQSRNQLQHAEKLATVGKLAANVAHEIRNPLTSIKMWLFSLRRAAGSELAPKFELISDEITRLENIVSSFLEFARPPRLRLAAVEVEPLLSKTFDLMRHRLREAGARLQTELAPGLPAVLGDSEQLRQVLLNLIINAMDAMPNGGEIEVTAAEAERGGRPMVVLRVADRGGGISESAQQRIFNPFFSTKEAGAGLGLSIAATVLARHDGALVLEKTSSQGTVFAVWIPVCQSAALVEAT